jgi:hypothetical protein
MRLRSSCRRISNEPFSRSVTYSRKAHLQFYLKGDTCLLGSSHFSLHVCQTRSFISGRVSYYHIGDIRLRAHLRYLSLARLRYLSPICISYVVVGHFVSIPSYMVEGASGGPLC